MFDLDLTVLEDIDHLLCETKCAYIIYFDIGMLDQLKKMGYTDTYESWNEETKRSANKQDLAVL